MHSKDPRPQKLHYFQATSLSSALHCLIAYWLLLGAAAAGSAGSADMVALSAAAPAAQLTPTAVTPRCFPRQSLTRAQSCSRERLQGRAEGTYARVSGLHARICCAAIYALFEQRLTSHQYLK